MTTLATVRLYFAAVAYDDGRHRDPACTCSTGEGRLREAACEYDYSTRGTLSFGETPPAMRELHYAAREYAAAVRYSDPGSNDVPVAFHNLALAAREFAREVRT